jgi:hypothetical protein
MFQKAVSMQDVTNSIGLPSSSWMQDISFLPDSAILCHFSHAICPTDLLRPYPAQHFRTSLGLFVIFIHVVMDKVVLWMAPGTKCAFLISCLVGFDLLPFPLVEIKDLLLLWHQLAWSGFTVVLPDEWNRSSCRNVVFEEIKKDGQCPKQ